VDSDEVAGCYPGPTTSARHEGQHVGDSGDVRLSRRSVRGWLRLLRMRQKVRAALLGKSMADGTFGSRHSPAPIRRIFSPAISRVAISDVESRR
jgi:hypothetical protein